MEVDKWGTRKRRAWKFRGISSKKRVISDVGVPRELWTPWYRAIDCLRPNELPANPLEGKPDRSTAREGHWLMFFYAGLRSALWISRASLHLDLFYRFAFRTRCLRSLDAAANVFWDLIEGAERRIHKEVRLRHLYIVPLWRSIF